MQPRSPEWYVISLRPRGMHAAVRRAATRYGAGVVALSPWVLRARDDAAARSALDAALQAPRVLFTSPAAVRSATALHPLAGLGARLWLAVGAGTAAALRAAGVHEVVAPDRMDSEGLLALPALRDLAGTDLGLVTAPDGRGVLAPALRARGARILRADVYEREPVPPDRRAVAALLELEVPAVLLLTSGGALARIVQVLPPDALAKLRRCAVVPASERLRALAAEAGFGATMRIADGPRPAQLLAAAAAVAGSGATFR